MRSSAFVGAGVAASVAAALLGYAQKLPCSSGGAWNSFTGQFRHACYTDIYPLYYNEGLSSGQVPYSGHPVEYPVLIGAMMQLAAWIVHSVTDPFNRGKDFYYVTVVLLAVCLAAGVLATGYAASRERDGQLKTELMVALSPALILSAFINWDLLAMALTAGGIAAWAARREILAGVLLGLAVATKFYPLLMFAALLLLCLRAGRMREFGKAMAAGAVAWLLVNVPIAIAATAGWGRFYAFSRSRGADWGSLWYMFEHFNVPVLGNPSIGQLNLVSSACFAVAFLAICVLALAAPRRPRLPQLCFLLLASFLMLNKVWSPQYVVWLVPFAVLARPRLWPYLLWQLTEVAYFFGIWGYFVYLYRTPGEAGYAGVSPGWYFAILLARFLAVGLLAAVVVTDILRPERDLVRISGQDDPTGGVLDGAPDRIVLSWERGARRPAQMSPSLSTGPAPAGPKIRARASSQPRVQVDCQCEGYAWSSDGRMIEMRPLQSKPDTRQSCSDLGTTMAHGPSGRRAIRDEETRNGNQKRQVDVEKVNACSDHLHRCCRLHRWTCAGGERPGCRQSCGQGYVQAYRAHFPPRGTKWLHSRFLLLRRQRCRSHLAPRVHALPSRGKPRRKP